jgi:hypothetical protein
MPLILSRCAPSNGSGSELDRNTSNIWWCDILHCCSYRLQHFLAAKSNNLGMLQSREVPPQTEALTLVAWHAAKHTALQRRGLTGESRSSMITIPCLLHKPCLCTIYSHPAPSIHGLAQIRLVETHAEQRTAYSVSKVHPFKSTSPAPVK